MAAIQQIRKRWKLVFGLIGLAIVAFVLSDLLRSNRSLLQGQQQQSNHVGEINGEKIAYQEFQERVNRAKQNFKRRRQTDELSERMLASIQDRAWQQLVFSKAFQQEQEVLGLEVTDDELFSMVQGQNPHPSVKRAFRDPQTGEFNRQNLRRFLQRLNEGMPNRASQRQVQRFEQQKQQWLKFEESMMQQREREKFFALVKKSFHVTDLEARRDFMNENKTASISYIAKEYRQMPDSAAKVTESELRDYYKNHKDQYKREEPSRSVEYVIFDVTPTAKDSAQVREEVETLADRFRETTKDSTFVALHSQEPYDSTFQRVSDIPARAQDKVLNADTGDVIGPYLGDKGYTLTKLKARKPDTVTYFKAKHILFQPEGASDADTTAAEEAAQEVYQKIRQGADFDEMGAKHHDGSKVNLGWFREGRMADPFEQGVRTHEKGEVFTVNTQFGTHIIKPTAEPVSQQFKLANVKAPVFPGDETYEQVYQEANEFRASIAKPGDFNKEVREADRNKRIADEITPSKQFIPGLSDAGKLVQWAYSNDEGDLSGILELQDQYVIAKLTEVRKKGTKSFEAVKDEIRPEVREKKLAAELAKQFEEADQQNKGLQQVASQLNVSVQNASNLKFSEGRIPGEGQELPVVGAAFGLQPDMTSEPIEGSSGIYQIKLNNTNSIDPPAKLASTKEAIRSNMAAQSQAKTISALRDMAKVKDLRFRFN